MQANEGKRKCDQSVDGGKEVKQIKAARVPSASQTQRQSHFVGISQMCVTIQKHSFIEFELKLKSMNNISSCGFKLKFNLSKRMPTAINQNLILLYE